MTTIYVIVCESGGWGGTSSVVTYGPAFTTFASAQEYLAAITPEARESALASYIVEVMELLGCPDAAK